MSATAQVAEMPASRPKITYNEAFLKGRLISAKRPAGNSKFWSHLIVIPAPDPYSSPSTVEVLASKRLGERDEDLIVRVSCGGYRRSYRTTDKETGEVQVVQTADNKFFAIED